MIHNAVLCIDKYIFEECVLLVLLGMSLGVEALGRVLTIYHSRIDKMVSLKNCIFDTNI